MTRVVLDEASGPVSPRFQYTLFVSIQDGLATVASKGGPLGTHTATVPVDEGAIVAALAALPLVDLVDEARAARVGIRVNRLVIDDREHRYLRSDLDESADAVGPAALRRGREAILTAVRAALDSARS
ncbi:MAG: hypothetical protein IPJ34_09350 [Myxococcales bacterium]|nr:hypothetical protein [Myxococcales bacterium]